MIYTGKKEIVTDEFFIVSIYYIYTVVPRYNDDLYNGNLDFRRDFFGNRSFLIKIYYVITEFTLSNTDGDFRRQIAFLYIIFTHYNSRKIHPIIVYLQKISTGRKPLRSLSQIIDSQIKGA